MAISSMDLLDEIHYLFTTDIFIADKREPPRDYQGDS